MLIKLTPTFSTLARQERMKQAAPLTKKQWINADRIVMIILFLGVIAAAIVFSV